ncbi:MAG: transcription antitermination protein [Halolamina sp.]
MNADTFRDDLRAARDTELSRLSSSKAVYALTGGEMDGDAVRAGTARELAALEPIFDDWADGGDGDAAALFADATEFAAGYAGSFDGAVAAGGADRHVVADALAGREGELERLAAAAAAFLVLDELAGQLVGFFVGDADRKSADEFRTFRTELAEYGDEAADLLAARCESEADEEAARDAGAAVVDGAYDWYVETLESMGVEPKNVC